MNCEILNTLYVKSNGEVLCNDDYGERVKLGVITREITAQDISALFNNEQYQTIRDAFSRGEVPWKGICEHCAFIRHDEPFSDYLSQKHITKLQVEPSLVCNLNCLGCTNDIQIATREKPHLMAPDTFEALLRALRDGGYRLDSIEFCGQGEPLMHPRFEAFVQIARRYYPQAWQRVITNGNFAYAKKLGSTTIDEIMVAGDGLYQKSYSSYRVKGEIDTVLQFMQDAVAAKIKSRPLVIWKYILFVFNDSDEEIKAAQEKALELGVDTLVFVITHSADRSLKYTMENIASLPVIAANVTTNAHPSFFDGVLYGKKKKSLVKRITGKFKKGCKAEIDEVLVMPGNILQIRGWAAAVQGVSRVVIRNRKKVVGETVLTDLRPDVEQVYPLFTRQPMGFRVSASLAAEPAQQESYSIDMYDDNEQHIARFTSVWMFTS